VDPARRLVKEDSLHVLNPGEQVVQSLVSPVLVLPGGFLPCCLLFRVLRDGLRIGNNSWIVGPTRFGGRGRSMSAKENALKLTLGLKRDVGLGETPHYMSRRRLIATGTLSNSTTNLNRDILPLLFQR
jgi:hypothetical protein